MTYIPLKVYHQTISGFIESMEAMRLPKGSKSDSYYLLDKFILGPKDTILAGRLIRAGDDHAKALRGIIAYITLELQVGFMIEFETYRFGVECLSTSSSMHNELKTLKGSALAEQKQADLPNKVYVRKLVMSYQALRRIYYARRYHRHPDWQIFCNFIETLPYFTQLILANKQKEKDQYIDDDVPGCHPD